MVATVGRFEIEREVVSAPHLSLYKANDPKGQRIVALYVMRTDSPAAAQFAARFRDHAKNASILNSPNIPRIYGGAAEGAMFLISMEYVEGTCLRATLAHGDKFSTSEVVDLARQVCSALDHAHHHHIFHTDLHPGNFIVEFDGTAKIMDFGVPKDLAFPAPDPPPDRFRYLSPEQVKGAPPDARSNLFSWGTVLYEIVTGRKAFAATSAEELRREILESNPPAPQEVIATVPAGISQAIMKALAKDPAARYQHGSDMLSELENYRRAERPPVQAAAPQAGPTGTMRIPVPPMNRPAPAPPPPPVVTYSNGAGLSNGQQQNHGAAVAPSVFTPPQPTTPPPPRMSRATAAVRDATAKLSAPETDRRLNKILSRVVPVVGVLAVILASIGVVYYIQGRGATDESTPPENSATDQPARKESRLRIETTPTDQPAQPKEVAPAAPAPAAPVFVTGEAAISSVPEGAQVLIDGNSDPSWRTPLVAMNLTVGQHSITISKPGFASRLETIQVEGGRRVTLIANLAELSATVAVSSEPAGATVIVDGRETGKSTPAQLVLPRGKHSFIIRKAGFFDYSTEAQLIPGQSLHVSAGLRQMGNVDEIKTAKGGFGRLFGGSGPKDMASLQIKTRPKGARITINGRVMGKNAPADFFLQPGHYEVVLEMRGYRPVRKMVSLETTSKIVMDEALQK